MELDLTTSIIIAIGLVIVGIEFVLTDRDVVAQCQLAEEAAKEQLLKAERKRAEQEAERAVD